MMLSDLYAHSLPNTLKLNWQRLSDHLKQVAEMASEFSRAFQSEDWCWNAAWLHDLGKADDAFQAYLLRENGLDDSQYDATGRVNHSSAGASFAEQKHDRYVGRTLAYLVAGHHAGLPDWSAADTGNAALEVRLREGDVNLQRITAAAGEVSALLRHLVKPPAFVKPDNYHFWVRFLYSCLVDADFLDTEAFMQPGQSAGRGQFADMAQLKAAFDQHMMGLVQNAAPSLVNQIRREVLEACRNAAKQPCGLFSLTVPTGGGKTLSAMAFALDHAVQYKKQRIIYVIPYTSIIEQTAEVLSSIFGADQVIEHHSNLDPERETPRSSLAAENWDAPIIITTNVQFFESLFAARSSRCRKLHNIVNSVVILDEAQLLPPELLTPCISAFDILTKHYGVTIVLSTATQPALSTLPPPLPCLPKPTEIVPDPPALYRKLQRTAFVFPACLKNAPLDAVAQELVKHPQVLCIVNTRRDCYDLHKLMPEGTVHLSAVMCGEHRSQLIANIKCVLKAGEPIRVVSTQLVEAGVDIDFPVVYRALAGLDSLAQAAGRCNREGRLNDQGLLGEVHVFVPPEPAPRGLLLKGENTTRVLLPAGVDMHSPGIFDQFFQLFYAGVNDTGSQYRNWLIRDAPDVQFRTAAMEFKLIGDSAQRPVFVRYGDGNQWIERLRHSGPTRDIMRHLQRYTVNLPRRMADDMLNDGRLAYVNDQKAPDMVVQGRLKYDARYGLDIYCGSLQVEDLII
ncbi:MAG: CRISPR-associated helicase Cas3' [Candidatus Sumerlaeota bacterium]|nr:CRISPR-associated helicase Cas3' [Candidatus Sumerlaeota bacterium]